MNTETMEINKATDVLFITGKSNPGSRYRAHCIMQETIIKTVNNKYNPYNIYQKTKPARLREYAEEAKERIKSLVPDVRYITESDNGSKTKMLITDEEILIDKLSERIKQKKACIKKQLLMTQNHINTNHFPMNIMPPTKKTKKSLPYNNQRNIYPPQNQFFNQPFPFSTELMNTTVQDPYSITPHSQQNNYLTQDSYPFNHQNYNLFSQDSRLHSIYADNNINSHIGNSNILPTLIRGSRQSLKDVLQIPNNIQPNNQNNQNNSTDTEESLDTNINHKPGNENNNENNSDDESIQDTSSTDRNGSSVDNINHNQGQMNNDMEKETTIHTTTTKHNNRNNSNGITNKDPTPTTEKDKTDESTNKSTSINQSSNNNNNNNNNKTLTTITKIIQKKDYNIIKKRSHFHQQI